MFKLLFAVFDVATIADDDRDDRLAVQLRWHDGQRRRQAEIAEYADFVGSLGDVVPEVGEHVGCGIQRIQEHAGQHRGPDGMHLVFE